MDFTLLLFFFIITFGGFIKGLTGFGIALVTIPFISLIIGVKVAVPLIAIFSAPFALPIIWQLREYIDWSTAGILFIGSLPGCYFGASLLTYLPETTLLLILGCILVVSSIYCLSSKSTLFSKENLPSSLLAGFLSGVCGASVGASGPPVIAYTSMLPWPAHKIKGTLSCLFLAQLFPTAFVFWHKGLLTEDVFSYGIKAIPALLLGTVLGMWGYHLLFKYNINFRRIVHTMLLVIGFKMIYSGI
ncbi:MAG: putative membrane protein YfcA [Psychromonas sp.]|uniref:sulfite exporter TauE/SafE family protein n=1 Tax=Psychromonas sp. TaxID=1884585 RepID=UPI0039E4B7F2